MPTYEQNKRLDSQFKKVTQVIKETMFKLQSVQSENQYYIDNVGGAIDVDFFLEETSEGEQWEHSIDVLEESDLIMSGLLEQAEDAIAQCVTLLNEAYVEETGIVYEPEESEEESE